MTRFAQERRVFFFEEPLFDTEHSRIDLRQERGVHVVVPHLPRTLARNEVESELRNLFEQLISMFGIRRPILWYYTPMALAFTRDIEASAVVFDCMDELSAFQNAPPGLLRLEADLLARAHVVFTGGQSLYLAKRDKHPRVHAFPSSVDKDHFGRARHSKHEPPDQAALPHPRIGFFGVIDERMDLDLLRGAAELRPDWQFVLLGPCVKIDPHSLPRRTNIHWLGMKSYEELPDYLGGWDVAMLPFARNDATRFISPTKTPEYLAAGCPVVSTSICDVVHPYGVEGLVEIADTPDAFVAAIERLRRSPSADWRQRVSQHLATLSWDDTWKRMCALVDDLVHLRDPARTPSHHIASPAGFADSAPAV